MSARDAILQRIRNAGVEHDTARSRDEDYAAIDRPYRQISLLTRGELVDLFAANIVHYDGNVVRCPEDGLPDAIAATLAARGKSRLVIPVDLDRRWLPGGDAFMADTTASPAELDAAEGVLTGCTVAVALTGTIILTHREGEGRRALTLVPDYHLAVVFSGQIVETVPEAFRRAFTGAPRLVTMISGPSATADIEMTRIKGVHGPRTLDVILVA